MHLLLRRIGLAVALQEAGDSIGGAGAAPAADTKKPDDKGAPEAKPQTGAAAPKPEAKPKPHAQPPKPQAPAAATTAAAAPAAPANPAVELAERTEAEAKAARKRADDLAKMAADAARAAAKAVEVAKKLAEEAEAARADADGLVLCVVPNNFQVVILGKVIKVPQGTVSLTREVATHQYSKAHGVKIVGLPTRGGKA